jgi:hypothetical protein
VIGRLLQLLLLQFDPLLRGGYVDESAPDLGDVVEHLLVGVVEHLVGIFGRVECLVRLGRDDVVRALEETHGSLLPATVVRAAYAAEITPNSRGERASSGLAGLDVRRSGRVGHVP